MSVSLDTQYGGTDRQLRAQLHSLGTMLPTVQMHLIMCTTFSSTANKFEFLNMAYQLIDRLTALAHLTYPLRPGNSSDMTTDYKVKFVECLEPVLGALGAEQLAAPPPATAPPAAGPPPPHRSVSKSLPATPKHKSTARVEFQTDFPEHCQVFDGHMKVSCILYNALKSMSSQYYAMFGAGA